MCTGALIYLSETLVLRVIIRGRQCMKITLNGSWMFKESTHRDWMDATVPGSNYLDLLSNGEIEDPFVATNENKVRWIGDKDWEYTRTFELTEDAINEEHIYLHADMIDTIADIYINDRLIGKANNCHIAYDFNIKNFVHVGENSIRIYFYSPVAYATNKQKEDAMPHNNMGVTGIPHIRKPQCHFGWDWGPTLPVSGITRDIYIHAYSGAKILDLRVLQHFNEDMTAVDIELIPNISTEKMNGTFSLACPDGNTLSLGGIIKDGVAKTFHIENPELWWTADISGKAEQPVYTAKLTLANHEEKAVTIGLRTIALNREKDEYGRNFQFVLNGIPLFIKGSNYIPPDSFITRFDDKKLNRLVQDVRDANMNMIRIWGGGYYESDTFYNACDKYGILVWQDFMFACAPYPFYDDEFLSLVKREVEYNVKRLRNHPCLALWCGNNEIEMMTAGWAYARKLIKWTGIFFHEMLPKMMDELDGITPYFPGSPNASAFMKNVNSDNDGDTHMWHVWHGLQPLNYYRKRMTRFCSEFGLESLPSMQTIKGFAKPSDYSLKSKVFLAHQKCASGNNKMIYYMSTRFRIPKLFEDIVYLSELTQEECVRDATEHWRRNRGRCNGSMYWQLNDCWPCSSWSSIDYEGRYKALQYRAKHFNAPVTISIEDNKSRLSFYIINDKKEPFEGSLQLTFSTFDGKDIYSDVMDVRGDALSSTLVYKKDYKFLLRESKDRVLYIKLYNASGELVAYKTQLFDIEKNLALPHAKFLKIVKLHDGIAEIKIKSNVYARFVKVEIANTSLPLSDNFFDLKPFEEKIITVPVEHNMSAVEIERNISIVSVADIEPRGTRLGDAFTRAKIRLIPINVANWIYYHTV